MVSAPTFRHIVEIVLRVWEFQKEVRRLASSQPQLIVTMIYLQTIIYLIFNTIFHLGLLVDDVTNHPRSQELVQIAS